MKVHRKNTKNKWKGRKGHAIQAVVVHITAGSFAGAESWIMNPKSQVSYHYMIDKSGIVHQYVSENDTAWHAGVIKNPKWKLYKKGVNPNRQTVGVALALHESEKPTLAQVLAASALIAEISTRHKIPLDKNHIIGHYMINANKTCPGHYVSVSAITYLASIFKRVI